MSFTFVTWNILATAYIRPEYYPRTSAQVLDAAWRIPALVSHAQRLNTDILCLQEVETAVFTTLEAALTEYTGVFHRKTGNRPDGCATFFRKDRFDLVSARRVAYHDAPPGGRDTGNIAQCMVLAEGEFPLLVVNTHLKWDAPGTPVAQQLGRRQILEAIHLMDHFAADSLDVARLDEAGRSSAQIVCGDFNAAVGSDVGAAMLQAGFHATHSEMPEVFTCNSNSEAKLIDHIFWRGALEARPIPPAIIDSLTPLPSLDHPSDHLPLAAEFRWREPRN